MHGDADVGPGIELWYDNFDDWRRSAIEQPPAYTKPDWATADAYPFLEPYRDFVCTFILERPTDEFHRDARGYLAARTRVVGSAAMEPRSPGRAKPSTGARLKSED
ncbi:MAG TPA: hypothetical protein VKP60_10670 [Magnetospirillaceae bacterium]|nr:hypothetical protein [Magnetospirillaceae bacterium]